MSSLGEIKLLVPAFSQLPDVIDRGLVVDGRWGLDVLLLVANFSDGSSQDLSTSCLGYSLRKEDTFESAEGADILSYFEVDLGGHRFP